MDATVAPGDIMRAMIRTMVGGAETEMAAVADAGTKGRKNPEERIRARNEAKILKAAVELFSRKGFDGTRIAEIAEASELPKANVYYYFSTKEEIYTRLIESVLEGWDKALEHIRSDSEPREALTAYVTAKLDYSRQHAAESRFFANEMMRGGTFLTRKQKQHMQEITRDRAAVVEGWIRSGKMAPIDPRHFFILLWSATQFYGDFEAIAAPVLDKSRLTKADFAEAADTITRTILAGCLA
ncbi:TetR/AcrR family transcriptional regulator [Mesorhizobium sp. L-8-3]|uniref:TetR/AcrR family transcriptional regulator n=1 Tax=Mesorhizobium sp. L-8-3 TaxID=2744522 RepID=UPI0019358D8B|nr:TetR/AcrR family transcriptional regulator [Mesorhizobium sp. L-8-3]BCH23922.1 TetR family transcriptional regulator [Mesorhizobium sp. L-8-3]